MRLIEQQTERDSQSGLYNRSSLGKRLESEIGGTMQVIVGVTGGPVDDEKAGLIKLGEDIVKDLNAIGKKAMAAIPLKSHRAPLITGTITAQRRPARAA